MTRQDGKLRDVINDAGYVIADGLPIVWLARRLGYGDVHRVTGIDLAESLLACAGENGWKLYFLGASPENLVQTLSRVSDRYRDITICGSHHGYFDAAKIPNLIRDINASRPDVLFLGLGLPQKEYFLADHFGALDVPFCITVGGAFDIWGGAKKRTPRALQRVGLEWLFRTAYDWRKASTLARYMRSFLFDFAFVQRTQSTVDTACPIH